MAPNFTSTAYGSTPDVTFVFHGSSAIIKVEKNRLMNISEVFRTQFSSDFDDIQPIEITDVSFEIFNLLMNFIYKSEISITTSNYKHILYASTKYLIYPIISKVIKFALAFITLANVVDAFEFFDKYEILKINEHILKVCVKQPLNVIAKLNGINCTHMKILKEILQFPIMGCTEYELYVAIVKMMENVTAGHVPDVAEEMRKKFGNLIYLIKFPTMSLGELIRCGNPPSLLTTDQHSDLLLWVEGGLYKESVKNFSTNPRINLKAFIKCHVCGFGTAWCDDDDCKAMALLKY